MKRIKKSLPDVVDELRNVYDIYIEVMENPQNKSWIALLGKLKPVSKPPINLKLFDKKEYIDYRIKEVTREILQIIGFS